ncbi:MAG TPA: sulfatase-like hydrolase/transferase, partial [Acidimicrobiales bacterium]|nr:sulfatase-like hydrolase/transferase [Acidimicrobiales bacterium]
MARFQPFEPFEGEINRTHAESTPWWPTPPHPGDEAPNVVVVLIDDLGYSHFGCYGSDIETPNIDSLDARLFRHENHIFPANTD